LFRHPLTTEKTSLLWQLEEGLINNVLLFYPKKKERFSLCSLFGRHFQSVSQSVGRFDNCFFCSIDDVTIKQWLLITFKDRKERTNRMSRSSSVLLSNHFDNALYKYICSLNIIQSFPQIYNQFINSETGFFPLSYPLI